MTTDEPGAVPPPPTAPLPSAAEPHTTGTGAPHPDATGTDATPSAPAPSAPVVGAPSPDADLAPAAPYGSTPTTPLPPAPAPPAGVPGAATPAEQPDEQPAVPAGTASNPYAAPPVPVAPGSAAPAAPAPGLAPAPGPAPAYGAAPAAPAYGAPGYGAGHGAPPPYLAPGTGQPGGFPPGGPKPVGKGMAITALVLAGVALLLSWVPVVNYLAGALAVAGLVVGVVALVKARPGRGLAIAGTVVAVVSVAMVVASHAVYSRLLTEFVQQVEDAGTAVGEPVAPSDELPADPSTDPLAPEDAPADEAPADEPAGALAAGFDQAFAYEDGLVVTVGAPAPFVPSGTAVTGPTGEHLRMTVTIQNGTAEEYSPTLFLAEGTSAGAEAEQVFDFENDLGMAPSDAVPPGGSVQFDIAFTVPDPASFAIEVSPSFIVYEPFLVSAG